MDPHRREWNDQQQQLEQALERLDDPDRAIQLFLRHHAGVHSRRLAVGDAWSFEDEALAGLSNADFRTIPTGEEHSIAWVLWHLARIEDVTMNLLVAGTRQVFLVEGWKEKIGFDSVETGNALDAEGIQRLSESADIEALQVYRLTVGRRTRAIVQALSSEDLRRKVQPDRLEQVMAEGAVVDSTHWLVEYWGKKTVAGLLLMPPTRHNFVHLNEAARLNKKVRGRVGKRELANEESKML